VVGSRASAPCRQLQPLAKAAWLASPLAALGILASPWTVDKTTGKPYLMIDDEFAWREAKARSNLAKHKVSFEAARLVFDDVFALERLDAEYTEVRYIITGMAKGVILTVVYTERDGLTHIISARKATKHEQRDYYRSQTAE